MSQTSAGPGMAPGQVLERRRFRSWDGESEPPARPWTILVRYGIVRMLRTWWIATLLVLVLVYDIVIVGVASYAFADGNAADYEFVLVGVSMLTMPAVLFLLLLGSPSFAEDVRVNAPLFYFSRPLHRDQYVIGKTVTVGGLLAAITLVPMVVCILLMLLLGIPLARQPSGPYVTAATLASWKATHIDTFADGLYTSLTVLLGTVLVLAFLTSGALLCSAYTKRGWHAGVAFVALLGGWSMLGSYAGSLVRSVYGELFSPAGWADLAVTVPQTIRYTLADLRLDAAAADTGAYTNTYLRSQENYYAAAPGAIALAYVLLAATTLVFSSLTLRRIRTQGGDL